MNKSNVKKTKKHQVKVTYREFRKGVLMPQFDLGYKTDAVKEVREMRGHY
jgi:uncharacterized protein YdgA (DUF945 family)